MDPSAVDLRDFHRFLDELIASGRATTPEDAVDEWRTMHPTPEMIEEDVLAVGEALEGIANGDKGMDFDEFARELRARYGLP